ncbi:PPR repeat protein [Actinidia rufa]|uniref:PPR repeat protein n=1 Tax=Actinidia rufa TaxID=165716 RepID=A0A7J0ESK7_9ERIC|nr:PPR repeat protein [Actinidia rufa]
MDEAEALFRDMKSRGLLPDHVNYTSLMDGLFKAGKEPATLNIAQEMTEKNIELDTVAYNVLINGIFRLGWHCEAGEVDKAMDLLNEMRMVGFHPTLTTYILILEAVSANERAEIIMLMHKQQYQVLNKMMGKGISEDTITYNALIHGYCKSSHLKMAFATYSRMLSEGVSPNIATYNILSWGLLAAGLLHEAAELIDEMKERGFVPNGDTYNILVSGYAKMVNKKESIKLHCEMVTKGFLPKTSTYNVLISDFSNARKMKQARELMNEMQARGAPPNSLTYDMLISGWCKLSHQAELESVLDGREVSFHAKLPLTILILSLQNLERRLMI